MDVTEIKKASGRLVKRRTAARSRLPLARSAIQVAVGLFLIYTGWRFSQFVLHFETFGRTPLVDRPETVDAFLPLSALVALKAWTGTGQIDRVHPAALILLVAFVLISVISKKGFCSWLCPIGALSERLASFGRWGFGRNFRLPAFLDWPLRSIKYLLLLFFVDAILIGMSSFAAAAFLDSPYNKVADVKMLQFFISPSSGVVAFLVALAVLSIVVSNFWCRYLCPYGALLGIASIFSPLKVTRNAELCTGCGLCTRACGNRLDVANSRRVWSPECSGCMDCVVACPRSGALGAALPGRGYGRMVTAWSLPVLLLSTLFGVILVAHLTGNWESGIGYAEYARLIPRAGEFGH